MARGSAEDRKKKVDEARKAAVDVIVKMMEEKGLHWVKEWDSRSFLPYNGMNGRNYRGGNHFHLLASAYCNGYSDQRWFTFNQALKLGYPPRKGERATPIEFWQPHRCYYDKDAEKWIEYKNPGDVPEGAERRTWMKLERIHYVFNAEQLANDEGDPFPPLDIPDKNVTLDEDLCEIADRLESTSRCQVVESAFNSQAFYDPRLDQIKVPERRDFTSMESFITTLAHELTHSTMVPLGREDAHGNAFGSEKYAFEELVAELGSTFTCLELGVHRTAELETDENFENHAAYLQGWLRKFKSDPKTLFDAMVHADSAADYIMSRYNPGWKEALEESRKLEIERIAAEHLSKLLFHPNQLEPVEGREGEYALSAEPGRFMRAAYSAADGVWRVECRGFGGDEAPACAYGDTFEEAYLAAYRDLELKGRVAGVSIGDPGSGKSCHVGRIAWQKVKVREPDGLGGMEARAIPLCKAQPARQPQARR